MSRRRRAPAGVGGARDPRSALRNRNIHSCTYVDVCAAAGFLLYPCSLSAGRGPQYVRCVLGMPSAQARSYCDVLLERGSHCFLHSRCDAPSREYATDSEPQAHIDQLK
ncbi:hypothetical protein EVAR_54794_1 [Eumeta japonica]|uniref:Uncharacterized protein n=1 Tax=Eumeta variegata TaxID=151549 RepID=A0A4C1Y4R0_EUMVA|nr:hypothetical protein EVAR_54794_1 [Eumeta japonica]